MPKDSPHSGRKFKPNQTQSRLVKPGQTKKLIRGNFFSRILAYSRISVGYQAPFKPSARVESKI